jgi:hypothetical protein
MALSLETHQRMYRRNTAKNIVADLNNGLKKSRQAKITDTELENVKKDLNLVWLILESDVNGDCTNQVLVKIEELYKRIASFSV